MSSKTTNYNLHKIDLTDAPPDITAINPNWDTVDTKLKELETKTTSNEEALENIVENLGDDFLPISGGALTGQLTVMDNFNINKTYDNTEYKTYVRPLNYALGDEYTTGLIHYIGTTNNSQLLFNKNGVALRDNVAGKLYQLFGQHNAATAATSIRSNLYTYGTDDMTAGTSTLETGKMYLVYE